MLADQSSNGGSSPQVTGPLDVWFITDLVFCNFHCPYCCAYTVVTQDKTWHQDDSYQRFLTITERLSEIPYQLRIRMQTLGEPFTSRDFLARTGWLAAHDTIEFIELVTNGSLFKKRLGMIAEKGADLSKISLWTTYHHTEIEMAEFLEQVEYAREQGCFVVVNALAFPENIEIVEELHAECKKRDLRINVDPGYADGGGEYDGGPLVAMESEPGGMDRLYALTANRNVLDVNLMSAVSPDGELCSAGGDYFIILADGRVGPCCPLLSKGHQLGNILDTDFHLGPGKEPYIVCDVDRRLPVVSKLPMVGEKLRRKWPCKNKEDFGHLKAIHANEVRGRSFGWFGE